MPHMFIKTVALFDGSYSQQFHNCSSKQKQAPFCSKNTNRSKRSGAGFNRFQLQDENLIDEELDIQDAGSGKITGKNFATAIVAASDELGLAATSRPKMVVV